MRSKRCQVVDLMSGGRRSSGLATTSTTMSHTRPTEQELEEAFIKITFRDEREDQNKDRLYPQWEESSRSDHYLRDMPAFITIFSLRALE